MPDFRPTLNQTNPWRSRGRYKNEVYNLGYHKFKWQAELMELEFNKRKYLELARLLEEQIAQLKKEHNRI